MNKILIVDDELSIRESFALILETDYDIVVAGSGEAALKLVSDQQFDLVFLDIRMPGLNGLETLKELKELSPQTEIIMVTAVNDVQKASEAVKLGARDYVVKPFDVDHILKLADQIIKRKTIRQEGNRIKQNFNLTPPQLIGQDEKIRTILATIEKIKPEEHVLITGEVGTEKELTAQLIHHKNFGPDQPFKILNLTQNISQTKLQIQLLGQGSGSNTAELRSSLGLLEETKAGSLLINHLEHLPAKTFATLAIKEFSRSGSNTKIQLTSRLLGTSNIDLAKKNKEIFDFFAGVLIEIPPLRERLADLPLLINHFLNKYNDLYGQEVKIPAEIQNLFSNYNWPGNIQQLEGLIKRLVLISDKDVSFNNLPFDILLKSSEPLGSDFVSQFEKVYAQAVFLQVGKDKQKAADILGVNPTVLEIKLSA